MLVFAGDACDQRPLTSIQIKRDFWPLLPFWRYLFFFGQRWYAGLCLSCCLALHAGSCWWPTHASFLLVMLVTCSLWFKLVMLVTNTCWILLVFSICWFSLVILLTNICLFMLVMLVTSIYCFMLLLLVTNIHCFKLVTSISWILLVMLLGNISWFSAGVMISLLVMLVSTTKALLY